MHVVIVGCGRVGSGLARTLEQIGHSVAIVDREAAAFRRLAAGSGAVQRVVGLGFDADDLITAGIEQAEAFAAVTSGDNSNIVAARVAREQFAVPRVVARITDPRRAQVYQRLGIATVATVAWTTDQIMRRLVPDSVAGDWRDASGRLVMVQRDLPATAAGRPLAELSQAGAFTIAAVTRLGIGQVVDEGMHGQQGDVLHVVCEVAGLAHLDTALQGAAVAS